jgi:tetratricopeptide (TPR) repeat protein
MALKINLNGAFSIIDESGNDLTPVGAKKVTGVVAILGASLGFRRSRKDLQDLLWSDRSLEQQSASLRQALTELRRALGPYSNVLKSDRTFVSLDPTQVSVVKDSSRGLFLESVDLRDRAFINWLKRHRESATSAEEQGLSAQSEMNGPFAQPRLLIWRPSGLSASASLIASRYSSALARSISEQVTIEICEMMSPDLGKRLIADHVVTIEVAVGPAGSEIHMGLETGQRRRRLWVSHESIAEPLGEATLEHDAFQTLLNEAAERYLDALLLHVQSTRSQTSAVFNSRAGVKQLLSLAPDAMTEADDLLRNAFEQDERGVYQAWRALLRIVHLSNRPAKDTDTFTREAAEFVQQATQMEPLNSMVLAVASKVASLIENDARRGIELAQKAVRLNPSNGLGWCSLSIAAARMGAHQEAPVFAEKARSLCGQTALSHLIAMCSANQMQGATPDQTKGAPLMLVPTIHVPPQAVANDT